MVQAGDIAPQGEKSWWRRWLVAPLISQLTIGASPERMAWTIALGIVLGVFPILGSTTLMCFLVGLPLRLNQVVLHVFSNAVYPLHLALILVFIRLGEWLHGVPLISFSVAELSAKFKADPMVFFKEFGMAAWHGVSAWLLIAPIAAWLIKLSVMPVLRQLSASLEKRKAGPA